MDTPIDRRLRLRRPVAEFVQSTLPLRPEGGLLLNPWLIFCQRRNSHKLISPLLPLGVIYTRRFRITKMTSTKRSWSG